MNPKSTSRPGSSSFPLYMQIARVLRSQIRNQEYNLNDRLPTEDDLIRQYGVSRMTARFAYQELQKEHLVRRIPGVGTFLARQIDDRKAGEWSIESIYDFISPHQRQDTKRKFLSVRNMPAPDGLAKAMGIPVGAQVTELKRLGLVKGEPFYHATVYMLSEMAAQLPKDKLKGEWAIALLEEYCGIRAVKARQWLAASLADVEIAGHLQIRFGDPVLLLEIHFLDETGRVVEVSVDRYRTDHIKHYLELNRGAPAGSEKL